MPSPDTGPRLGPVRDLTGHAQSARLNPVQGLPRDLTGRAPGFDRAPYGHARDAPGSPVQICPFDLAMRKPGACPYGARTGLKRGCPCPDSPRCARDAPYQSRTGSDRDRYLGNFLATFLSFCKLLALPSLASANSLTAFFTLPSLLVLPSWVPSLSCVDFLTKKSAGVQEGGTRSLHKAKKKAKKLADAQEGVTRCQYIPPWVDKEDTQEVCRSPRRQDKKYTHAFLGIC